MLNPYLLDTPAVVSFSGGRTSGYMLWHVLQAFGGTLPDTVKVVFNNTGKERPETLDFVERCSQRWGVNVTWLEYRKDFRGAPEIGTHGRGPAGFAVVNYHAASRDGFPLKTAITARGGDSGFLPNPIIRYCTIETKVKTTIRYLRSMGWDHWTNAVGFRADEQNRVAKLSGPNREKDEDTVAPLALAGVTRGDVVAWWDRQSFRLELDPDAGNCDLCFLKGKKTLMRLMRENPEWADWWVEMEDGGGRFRNDRPTYRKMLQMVNEQPELFPPDDADLLSVSCHCTD